MAAIRYLIDDVDRAIRFYTQQLGFKLTNKWDQPLPTSQRRTLRSGSVDPRVQPPDRCPMGADQNPAGGIG